MCIPIEIIRGVFCGIAFAFSFAYAYFAIPIFTEYDAKLNNKKPDNLGSPTAWKWHQRWFNFVGSITGWAVLWFVLSEVYINPLVGAPNVRHGILMFIAFTGITGHLPFAIMGIWVGVKNISNKIVDSILGNSNK